MFSDNIKFESRIEPRDRWSSHEPAKPSDETTVAYTDGSKLSDGRAGAGVDLEDYEECCGMAMKQHTSVFQAEVKALTEAAHALAQKELSNTSIRLYTDSRALIWGLTNPRKSKSSIRQCEQALNELAEHNSVTVVWLPAHTGKAGNEIADRLAKQAAQSGKPGNQRKAFKTPNAGINHAISKWLGRRPKPGQRN